jgi:hypothetical protein
MSKETTETRLLAALTDILEVFGDFVTSMNPDDLIRNLAQDKIDRFCEVRERVNELLDELERSSCSSIGGSPGQSSS